MNERILVGIAGIAISVVIGTVAVTMIDAPETDYSSSDTYIQEYEFNYHKISVEIPVDYHERFSLGRFTNHILSAYRYVTPDDQVIQSLYLAMEPELSSMDDRERADVLQSFVHDNIVYATDSENHGLYEYTQYPSETLVSRSGDCEDFALLQFTLYKLAGLDAVLVHGSNHVYVGVMLDMGYYENADSVKNSYVMREATGFITHPNPVIGSETLLAMCLVGLLSMYT